MLKYCSTTDKTQIHRQRKCTAHQHTHFYIQGHIHMEHPQCILEAQYIRMVCYCMRSEVFASHAVSDDD